VRVLKSDNKKAKGGIKPLIQNCINELNDHKTLKNSKNMAYFSGFCT